MALIKKKVFLKKLNPKKDISKKYLDWMNSNVHRYTEQRYKKHTLNNIKKFVIKKNKSKNEYLYGIFIKENLKQIHIGNIKIGPINFIHKTAEISYFLGQKNLWGKGYMTEAINEIIKIARKKKLKKIKAGFYEMNYGSKKVLEKNGFREEGRLISEVLYNKRRYTYVLFGKVL